MTGLTVAALIQSLSLVVGAQAYDQAYSNATTSGRPLLVLVGADWCPACRVMKSSTLVDMERQGKLGDVAFSVVDTDRQRLLSNQLMSGGSIPQLILFEKTENGWRKTQLTGAQSAGQVEAFLRPATNRYLAAKSQQAKVRNVAQSSTDAPQ
jgi:thioredoxin-like negative regulator of GroEL